MRGERPYPEEAAGPFPTPPASFEDRKGREIEVRPLDAESELDALVEMYLDFDPSDRAQGIPPVGERRVREWLDVLRGVDATEGSETPDGRAGSEATREKGHNVVAWHGDRAVGHATLVPDDGAFELAIFVHQEYQGAGVGTRLIRHLLGYGASQGVEKVWLSVERWNRPAVALYESQGFETTSQESFELEMALRLDAEESTGE